ncbi:fatty acid desaturase family protein [Bradyrhizobium paxllaeri]|uniref:fatty acid desaturase family protein n=1 Tax=Bradyrhizobium paxllaeri TaxID=190148 RepID=UPI001FE2AC56|nr:fatty acid desaturase family protein [Bradyrhizobium paxllaeri]
MPEAKVDPKYSEMARAAHQAVDKEFLAGLKEKRPAAIFVATAAIWLQLILAWALALLGPLWLVFIPFLVSCALAQAMLLWVHEASHFSLFDDRRVNDIWSDVFFAGPIGITVAAYRERHSSHHAHLGTDLDQDGYPYHIDVRGRRALMAAMGRTLIGLTGLWLARTKYIGRRSESVPPVSPRWVGPLITVVFNLTLVSLCVLSGRWYLYAVLWVYPIVAVAVALNIVRSVAEHQPEDFPQFRDGVEAAMRPVVRTTVPGRFEKWMLYQANFNYHVEHHLFPTVPRHNLGKLHLHLVANGFYRQFPSSLQSSGFLKFLQLARNKQHDDFSGAIEDAMRL